jgi:1-acyl-sn-glycerol-3-phosphate acyltransferase
MSLTYWLVTSTIRGLTHVLCRIDAAELAQIPAQGPLIVVANHVNFLEVPIMYTHLQPRPGTGFAKAETWDSPVGGFLFGLWNAIPLRRGEADVVAIRAAIEALNQGYIVAVAPEGTRSGDGRMQRGKPGVVMLALRSGAPLLPVAYYGAEDYKQHFSRLRRAPFHVRVGRPFRLDPHGVRVTQQVRQQMVDEIMYQVAALLPATYRGVYSDLPAASATYLCLPAEPGDRVSSDGDS